jgi:hypothetical protein
MFLGIVAILVSGGHAKADFTFGVPTNLGPTINSSADDGGPCFAPDGLSLYYYSFFQGLGIPTVRMTSRATTEEPWGEAVSLSVSDIPKGASLNFSSDGLSLYFDSFLLGGYGQVDLFVSKRATIDDPWSNPVNLGPNINTAANDMGSTITADGLSLFFQSTRAGGFGAEDIYVCTRATTSDPWGQAENLGANVNSSFVDAQPFVLPDGLTLLFCSDGPDGYGDWDIWMTKRNSKDDDWGVAVNLGPSINTEFGEAEPCISPDGKELYFSDWYAQHPDGVGAIDMWQVPIEPIVDLNADGIVDAADMCIIVDHWGTDYSLCDIGPMPFGDGVVDVQDLIVLSEHLFKSVNDRTLIAHWAFDEAEGMYSADSVGDNDAIVLGGVEWLPASGQIDGALKLDGVSGYGIAGTVLNPADGPFSVFVWAKDCAPGQVIISQQNVSNWLAVDSDGNLMTELKSSDPAAGSLVSETVIADGQWHRIGLVWDGSQRKLYVDSVIVAEDTQDGLEGSESGLNIGGGKMTQPGTYFSGLIDDVRIYNRVVSP